MEEPILIHGDCLDALPELPEDSIDSIITDPPYGLSFMGKDWDRGVPGARFWEEMWRVAKPGAFLLAFGGTRTFHRMTCAIEDAGWEIRDCMMWLYGTGFPKSHNIEKSVGDVRWGGYGTALKPAWEPIIVAMKPCDGTFAQNALAQGVAGLNIEGSRIGSQRRTNTPASPTSASRKSRVEAGYRKDAGKGPGSKGGEVTGRWPANVILDEEAGRLLDEQSGESKSRKGKPRKSQKPGDGYGMTHTGAEYDDKGGASRFFYCAKASKKERGEGNNHPTVKPLALIEYLCKLTRPPDGGFVLDPFMGSGTTALACQQTGRSFIGIEKDEKYFEIAEKRLKC